MLSAIDTVRVRTHLGFPEVNDRVAISFNMPLAGVSRFLVDDAIQHLRPEAEPLVVGACDELDCILRQLSEARATLAVQAVDGIRFNVNGQRPELLEHYAIWQSRLANILGVRPNPVAMPLDGQGLILLEP